MTILRDTHVAPSDKRCGQCAFSVPPENGVLTGIVQCVHPLRTVCAQRLDSASEHSREVMRTWWCNLWSQR